MSLTGRRTLTFALAAIGAALTLVADANGDWATIAKNGTWNEEA